MSPRASSATVHELSRCGLLATLPGEILSRLAARMSREELGPGSSPADEGERFCVVLSGMLTAPGAPRPLRPGDAFGELAPPASAVATTSAVRALTPSVIASCDRETFEELVRPQLG
jgi:CRP-like cAMP-binding protein